MIELINFLGQYLCFFILHICGNGSFPKPLSEKEEHEYLVRSAKGDIEARNILVEHNQVGHGGIPLKIKVFFQTGI